MSKFKRVLSDEHIHDIVLSSPITLGKSIYRSKDFILMIEQAVLAKLAEQSPLGYTDKTGRHYFKDLDLAKRLMPDTEFIPLYAHPIPVIEQEPVAWQQLVYEVCVQEAAKRYMLPESIYNCMMRGTGDGNLYPDPLASLAELALSTITADAVPKEHHRTTKNHIPVTDNMTIPEGWQLVPKEPSRDMLKKMFYEIFGMDGIEEEYLAARYRNMLSSFPKYTGVIND